MTSYFPPTHYASKLVQSDVRKLEMMLIDARIFPLPKISKKNGITNNRYYLEWANIFGGRTTAQWIQRLKDDFEIQVIDQTAHDAQHYVMVVLLGMPVRRQSPPLRVVTKPIPALPRPCMALAIRPPMSIIPFQGVS